MLIERTVDFIGHTIVALCILGFSGFVALMIVLALLPTLIDWGII